MGTQDTRDVRAERYIKKREYKCGEMVRELREPAGRRPQGSADYLKGPYAQGQQMLVQSVDE